MTPCLGSLLQHALRPPPAPPPPKRLAPAGLYVAGAIAAGAFGAGALLLAVSAGDSMSLMMTAVIVLALVWLGALGTSVGGTLPILGCVGFVVAIAYASVHIGDRYTYETTIAVLGLGVGGFVGTHVLGRGLHAAVRVIAGCALVAVVFLFMSEAWHWRFAGQRAMYPITIGSLAAFGFALAGNLIAVADRARR